MVESHGSHDFKTLVVMLELRGFDAIAIDFGGDAESVRASVVKKLFHDGVLVNCLVNALQAFNGSTSIKDLWKVIERVGCESGSRSGKSQSCE